MNAVLGGLVALGVLITLAVVVVVLVDVRRRRSETVAERYQREIGNLQYQPQTWKTKRAAATRRQNGKLWAAGSAGAAAGFIVGMPGDAGGGDGGSGCGASGCGGAGCGGGGCGGGGCGGGGS